VATYGRHDEPDLRSNRLLSPSTDLKEHAVRFIQTITFTTDQLEAVEALMDEWVTATAGDRTAQRSTLTADRDRPNTYFQIVEFPSHEAAMANSDLPATSALAARISALCSAPPVFQNLDVHRVDDLS
jgi:quinol monooxygenase YgiN